MIFALAAFATAIGYVASRSVVAVSDSHRLELNDRWYGPMCASECDQSLNWSMARCREGHAQRRSNMAVLVAVVALSTAMVFVVPSFWLWPAYAVFSTAMVLLTVTDLDTLLIPNRMLGPSLAVGLGLLIAGWTASKDSGSLVRAIAAAAGYFAVMYILAVIARGGLGFGDVKLALMIGLFTGYLSWGATIVAGVGAFLIAGLVSLILLASKLRGRKDAIPFGPFMAVAGIIATIWGASITDWYIG